MTPRLSILIVTLECRALLMMRLCECLDPQARPEVEILIDRDNGQATIGEKRNNLLRAAHGDHVCFIDDDDLVAPSYIAALLDALKTGPDCVGFRVARFEQMNVRGEPERMGTYYHTLGNEKCDDIQFDNGQWRHNRWPGHLQPVRRDLAMATGFMPWCYGEDRDYAARLRSLLKQEVFIDEDLYLYLLRHDSIRQGETVHPRRWHDDGQIRLTRTFNSVPATA